jgi:Myb-like DNA-binding domain
MNSIRGPFNPLESLFPCAWDDFMCATKIPASNYCEEPSKEESSLDQSLLNTFVTGNSAFLNISFLVVNVRVLENKIEHFQKEDKCFLVSSPKNTSKKVDETFFKNIEGSQLAHKKRRKCKTSSLRPHKRWAPAEVEKLYNLVAKYKIERSKSKKVFWEKVARKMGSRSPLVCSAKWYADQRVQKDLMFVAE